MKKIFVTLIMACTILAGLAGCAFGQTEKIDGDWVLNAKGTDYLRGQLFASFEEAVFSHSSVGNEKLFPTITTTLSIKEDNAEMKLQVSVDKDLPGQTFKTEIIYNMLEEFGKAGVAYDQLDEETRQQVDQALAASGFDDAGLKKQVDVLLQGAAEDLGASYDATTGVISASFFKASVDQSARSLTVTESNSAIFSGDKEQSYTVKDNELTMNNDENSVFVLQK